MGNVIRLLPENFDAVIDMTSFETPEIFFEIQRRGQVSSDEMVRVFNCGLGMVVALDASGAEAAITLARAAGVTSSVVGEIRLGSAKVILT
jgi:phosphoribosylformylglycinamidine cyclo-ligase